jgi:hypothetical protein
MPHLNFVEIRIGKLALICAVCLLAASLARAEDWKTANGKTYRGVKVLAHTSTTVTILDQDGGATLNLADLPPDIQQKYGFDPKAAAVEKARADAEKAKEDAAAAEVAAAVKAKQEAQAAADKSARDAAAETIAVAARDLTEDQKEADTSSAKAKTDYAAADKAAIAGQVAIVTREHETIPIAATHVRLYSYDQAHAALELLSAKGGAEQKKLNSTLADERAKCVTAFAAVTAAKAADRAAAKKKADAALKDYHDTLAKYFSYSSQPYYADNMPAPLADSVTDAEGKFSMKIPKTGSWVLVAQGQHAAGGGKETCLWIAKIKTEDIARNQAVLNNDNLTGDDSLMTCPSDSDIASLIQNKIGELTP